MISVLENILYFLLVFVISLLREFLSSWFVPFRLCSQVSDFHDDDVDHTWKKRKEKKNPFSLKHVFKSPLEIS